jgi:NAD(P)-dependent dehydrogenase (short-subunit alcohol dehydrogenase family)
MNIIIIGGAGGIGSALCRMLSQDGAQVFIGGRDEEKLALLASETGAGYSTVDATQPDQVNAFFARGLEHLGRIDGAVNLAGSILLKAAHQTSDSEWQQVLATNLSSAFYTVRAASKAMIANTSPAGGSIVLVSTAAARLGLANHEAIAAAKAGVQGLALSSAATYARQNIRVNCVAPGLVDTPLAQGITGSEPMLKASTAMHALNRIGEPEDVASLIHFLLQSRNSWLTGQVVGVDGGLGTLRSR